MDFHRFCCDLVILSSYFDILGILGIWDKCAVFVFHLSLSFYLVGEFCWAFLFGQHKTKKPANNEPGVWWTEGVGFGISSIASSSLGDRKKGYPKRQALWELTLALGRFPFDFVFFFRCFVFFIDFNGF